MEKKIKIVEKGQQWLKYKPQALDIHQIAHPVDKALIKVLEKAHIKDILNEPMHQLVSANYGQLLATGIPLNQENFPELYALMQKTCTRLGIPIPYTIISNELSGINAFATGTDEDAFVVISNMAPRCLKPKELQFIISHECGHIAMEHMVYHTAGSLAAQAGGLLPIVGPILAQMVVFPLNCWNRCSEVTADRIGLICCEDLYSAQRALLRIVGGFTDIENIDIEHYILQSKGLLEHHTLGKLGEYFQTHPIIYKRLMALELFYNSECYYLATGKTPDSGAHLYTKQELDQKVDDLLRVV